MKSHRQILKRSFINGQILLTKLYHNYKLNNKKESYDFGGLKII